MDASHNLIAADPAPAPLLERPRAECDWVTFVDTYGKVIMVWFGQAGLPPADVQACICTIFAFLRQEFTAIAQEAELRFRAWLDYAIHTSWCRTVEVLIAKQGDEAQTPLVALLLSVDAHDGLLRAVNSECSRLRRRQLLLRMQERTVGDDWPLFFAVVLEGRALDDVAREFSWPVLAVQAAVHRVHSMLEEELRAVEEHY